MKHLITIMLILFSIESCSGSSKWSPYQGHMKWKEAKIKCESLGMRLPTIAELKVAFAAKDTEPWDKNVGFYYWSSSLDGAGYSFVLHVMNGKVVSHTHIGFNSVRCFR